jgi:O-antigen ligase
MHFKLSKVAIAFLLFFFAYVIGTFFTNHLSDALHSLERKLVFVAFPILFSFRFNQKLNLKPIAIGLISGVVLCSFLGLIHSFNNYQLYGDFNNSFGATTFSYIHHPTYFSAFLLVSFLFALEGCKLKWRYFNKLSITIFLLFTLLMQFFCFSFAGMLYLFLVLIFLGYTFIYQHLSRVIFYISLAIFPLVPLVVYKSNIHIQIIVDDALIDIKTFVSNPKSVLSKNHETYTGNQVRLILWSVSKEEFQTHPLGVGTSNLDDSIGARLRLYGLNSIADQNYNPHNQYLQVAVEIGILGLIVFLGLLGLIFSYALKWKNTLLFLICGNLAFNCIFESMLQRQSGIVFYTFVLLFVFMLNFEKTLPNFDQK